MATETLIAHLREKGETLRPETLMILLRAANTAGDKKQVTAINHLLIGTPMRDDRFSGGIATQRINRLARRFGYSDINKVAEFRSKCFQRMTRHLTAREGPPTLWEASFSRALWAVARDVWESFETKRDALDRLHPAGDVELEKLHGEPVDKLIELKLDDEALYAALARLPENQREAVQRHSINGESFVEIANGSGVTPDAIRHRYTQGVDRLKRDAALEMHVSDVEGKKNETE
jgi:DNA-directed RNA polymerase specialized sigma24 family protein